MLSFLIFFPLLGALLCLALPKEQERNSKIVAAATTAIVFAGSFWMFYSFDRGDAGLQFAERTNWIRAAAVGFDVQYHVGVDGLSTVLILLTGLLFLVAALISWNITLRPREYFTWLLALETAVMGV